MNMAILIPEPFELQAPSIYIIHEFGVGTSTDTTSMGVSSGALVSYSSVHSVKKLAIACPLMDACYLYYISNLLNSMAIWER